MSTSGVDIETDHDVVTVDLADGRDYPIYIGAGFNDKEGNYIYNVLGWCLCISVFVYSFIDCIFSLAT